MVNDHEQTDRLLATAEQAIRRTLADGKVHGYRVGEWVEHEVPDHVIHAFRHVEDADLAVLRVRVSAEAKRDFGIAVRHAICRLAMALALVEEP